MISFFLHILNRIWTKYHECECDIHKGDGKNSAAGHCPTSRPRDSTNVESYEFYDSKWNFLSDADVEYSHSIIVF